MTVLPKQGEKGSVYISGPMRGYDDFNYPKFIEKELWLDDLGFTVFNPANIPVIKTPAEYMEIDIAYVKCCDYIYILEGWERSKGATLEIAMAIYYDKKLLIEDGAKDPVKYFDFYNTPTC